MQPKKEHTAGSTISMPGPGIPGSGLRNLNVVADAQFAKLVVDAAVDALEQFDSSCKLRVARYSKTQHGESYIPPRGVKMKGLGTLRDSKLGTGNNDCRATLLELEFIDNPKVDALINGATANDVRNRIAGSIAKALVDAV